MSRPLAVAIWLAEQLRGSSRPFDKVAGYAGYEADPFKWKVGQGWLSQAEVTFEWAWWADGGWRRELMVVAAHNLSTGNRGVPIPAALKDEEQILLASLEEAVTKGFTPCEYLGVETCAVETGRDSGR